MLKEHGKWAPTIILVVIGLILYLVWTNTWTDDKTTFHTLDTSGYTNIHLTGHKFACGQDYICTGFIANGPSGKQVEGAVGCGFFIKGCTIRITGP